MSLTHPDVYRQSLLQSSTKCMRRTLAALKIGDDLSVGMVGFAGDLGTAFHAFMAKYLQTLGRPDVMAAQMPTQEAIECMYEVLAELPFVLPFEALDDLRWMVLSFCEYKWNPQMLASADFEVELRADVVCPDGATRVLKGQPDVLMFDPPDGLLVIDAKSGRGRPRGPRLEPEPGELVEGRQYLSDMFQGDTYSLLALRRYPAAGRVTFRELHIRSGQVRQSTLGREALEHVERKLATTMMLLDRAISEGEASPLWKPRPGSHCARQCPVARSCPIPVEQRGEGGIETEMQAHAAAQAWAVLEGKREALRGALKSWVDDPANAIPRANEHEQVRWEPLTGKGRRFGLHPVAMIEEVPVATLEEKLQALDEARAAGGDASPRLVDTEETAA